MNTTKDFRLAFNLKLVGANGKQVGLGYLTSSYPVISDSGDPDYLLANTCVIALKALYRITYKELESMEYDDMNIYCKGLSRCNVTLRTALDLIQRSRSVRRQNPAEGPLVQPAADICPELRKRPARLAVC